MTPPAGPVAETVTRLWASFDGGVTRSYQWRIEQLRALERFLHQEAEPLCEALALDLGKSDFIARVGDLGAVTAEIAYAQENLASWMRIRRVRVPLSSRPARAHYQYRPLGPALIIAPWNYPVQLLLSPVVAAISAGNPAMLKPSEHAPRTARVLAQRLGNYLDATAFAVIEGDAAVTAELLTHRWGHVFFTGGAEVGRKILTAAAQTLTPVTLELGGKCPALVTRDADIAVAARRVAFAKITNAGQTCVSVDYALVDKTVLAPFLEHLQAAIAKFTGDQPDSGLRIVNRHHTSRLRTLLIGHGGDVVCGGSSDVEQRRVQPTVILGPRLDSALMNEEIFGPILPVIAVDSLSEAMSIVALNPDPLAAYLFSTASSTQQQFMTDIRAGAVVINHAMMHVAVPSLPFGGVGNSGMGAYHGETGFQTFSHRRAVLIKPNRPDPSLVYPPYTRWKRWVADHLT